MSVVTLLAPNIYPKRKPMTNSRKKSASGVKPKMVYMFKEPRVSTELCGAGGNEMEIAKDDKGKDMESGIEHYKHMACNMAFICELMKEEDQ